MLNKDICRCEFKINFHSSKTIEQNNVLIFIFRYLRTMTLHQNQRIFPFFRLRREIFVGTRPSNLSHPVKG